MDANNLMTIKMLSDEMGIAIQTATSILKDAPSVPIGRLKLYDRDDVKQAIANKNAKVLEFLGYPVELHMSYDVNNVGV